MNINHPSPREIPAGKVMLSEYGPEIRSEMAVVELIDKKWSDRPGIKAFVKLEWSSPGWECAGSCARWTNGYWAVRYEDRNGCRQGRCMKSEDEARALFAKWTAPQ